MFYIGFFILCTVLVILSIVGLCFGRIRGHAIKVLLCSMMCAVLVVVWVYYPRTYARDYVKAAAVAPVDISLAQSARGADFEVGSAVRTLSQLNDAQYTQLFTSVTPENLLKIEGVVSDINTQEYNFTAADALVDQALNKGLRVRGHALVFGKASDMFKAPDLDAWLERFPVEQRKAILTDFMQQHITKMLNHYRGRIHEWDVVNEVLDLLGNGNIEENVFYRYVGPDYIRLALETAKQVDPTIKIYINEQLNNYTDKRAEAFYQLIKTLVDQGAPLDGIGLQGHSLFHLAPPETLKAYMLRFESLGLTIEITELEARLRLFEGEADPYYAQGEYYRDITRQCLAVAACKGITFWGYSDATSWMDDLYFLFPKPNEPYLLDSLGRVKPGVGLIDALFVLDE